MAIGAGRVRIAQHHRAIHGQGLVAQGQGRATGDALSAVAQRQPVGQRQAVTQGQGRLGIDPHIGGVNVRRKGRGRFSQADRAQPGRAGPDRLPQGDGVIADFQQARAGGGAPGDDRRVDHVRPVRHGIDEDLGGRVVAQHQGFAVQLNVVGVHAAQQAQGAPRRAAARVDA